MTDLAIPDTDGYVLRAPGQDEHESRDVVSPDGRTVGVTHYSSFSHRWHADVGADTTPSVADLLVAGRHAVWLWDFATGQDAEKPSVPFGRASREIPDALTEVLRRRQDLHNATARAYTAQYGQQPHLRELDAAFADLAERGHTRLTLRSAGELADGMESLLAPAGAWHAELVDAGASEAREWLVFPLVMLLRDGRRLQGRIRATVAEVRRRASPAS